MDGAVTNSQPKGFRKDELGGGGGTADDVNLECGKDHDLNKSN